MSQPQTHRVVACIEHDRTRIEQRAVPQPGPGEMLLDLQVVGLCGTDLFKLDTNSVTPGLVLGHEVVGRVRAVGPGVSQFRLGDRIAVPHHVACGRCALCQRGNETMCEVFREDLLEPGGFAERILVRSRATEHAARRIPDAISDAAAVFMEPAACVLRGVDRASLQSGLAVVLGAGSMGLLHLLVIRAVLPEVDVLMVDPVRERRELAERLGARASADPQNAQHSVATLSDALGADAVFDTVGGRDPLTSALSLTREGGSVVLFAHAPADAKADFDLNQLFKYERRIIGTYSGGLDEQRRIFDLLGAGTLDPTPLVTHTLPLERFDEGVTLMRARRALKVLYTPGEDFDQ